MHSIAYGYGRTVVGAPWHDEGTSDLKNKEDLDEEEENHDSVQANNNNVVTSTNGTGSATNEDNESDKVVQFGDLFDGTENSTNAKVSGQGVFNNDEYESDLSTAGTMTCVCLCVCLCTLSRKKKNCSMKGK